MSAELPKDSEGREIPLDTGTLYKANGIAKYIYHYGYDPRDKYWFAETDEGPRNTSEFLLSQPDSWEKLLEDLSEAGDARYYEACAYFHRDKDEDGCASCTGGKDGCARIAMRDIADRIRKLRGED